MRDRPDRLSASVAGLCLALLSIAHPGAQAPAQPAPPAASASGPQFDVVSVRRSADGTPLSMRRTPTGGLIITGMPLFQIVMGAFPPQPIPIKGVPEWTVTERYDITATASLTSPPTQEQGHQMLQALLAGRFGLMAHFERLEQPVFDLVLARTDGRLGQGLRAVGDCAAVRAAEQKAREAAAAAGEPVQPRAVDRAAPLPDCFPGMRAGRSTIEGDFTMASLAAMIQTAAGRPIVDKTGLTGFYRIKLEADGLNPIAGGSPGLSATAAPSALPTIFSALPDQLGLKLESSRAMIETLVIDRIERPSEN
jgi:uncharacterized protein (TIGR03435 family)